MKTHLRKLLVLVGVVVVTATASAQNYTLDSSSIGTGGTSTGGGYSLSGGISLAGAAQLSGGGYTVEAGFWTAPPANAPATIFDNTTGSDNGGFGVTATTWLASRFCLGAQAYQLDSVSLLLNSQDFSGGAGPPCMVQLQIYASDAVTGKPLTNIGPTMTLSSHTNPVALLRGQQLVRWTNSVPFTLVADTCYWAVLSAENGKRLGQISSFTKPIGEAGSFGSSSSANAGATWGTPASSSNNKMLIRGTAWSAPVPFMITSVNISGNDLLLTFPTLTGRTYAVESLTNLVGGGWAPLPGMTNAGTGASLQTIVSNAFAEPQQFFRIKQIP